MSASGSKDAFRAALGGILVQKEELEDLIQSAVPLAKSLDELKLLRNVVAKAERQIGALLDGIPSELELLDQEADRAGRSSFMTRSALVVALKEEDPNVPAPVHDFRSSGSEEGMEARGASERTLDDIVKIPPRPAQPAPLAKPKAPYAVKHTGSRSPAVVQGSPNKKRDHPCKTCAKMYAHKDSLARHVREGCPGDAQDASKRPSMIRCDGCFTVYKHRSNLERHIPGCIGPKGPDGYYCGYCQKACQTVGSLKRHEQLCPTAAAFVPLAPQSRKSSNAGTIDSRTGDSSASSSQPEAITQPGSKAAARDARFSSRRLSDSSSDDNDS